MAQIPQQRVIEKLDEYMGRKDYAGAERHLKYWLLEAEQERDLGGQLLVHNEMVGFCRKMASKEEALSHADQALALIGEMGLSGSVSEGTTCINAATACQAFGEYGRALPLFERARAIYEDTEGVEMRFRGGLYNNMALTCTSLGRYADAYRYYDMAMECMSHVFGGKLEQAITCLNRANALEAELGLEAAEPKIYDLLDQAGELLDDPEAPRDGYYAFVCEKCVSGFSYYGYFLDAEKFGARAKEIYSGLGAEE